MDSHMIIFMVLAVISYFYFSLLFKVNKLKISKTNNMKYITSPIFRNSELVSYIYVRITCNLFFIFQKVTVGFKQKMTDVYFLLNIVDNIKKKSHQELKPENLNGLNVDLYESIRDRINRMIVLIQRATKDKNESINRVKILKMALVFEISKAIHEGKTIYSSLVASNEKEFLISLIGVTNYRLLRVYEEDLTKESKFIKDLYKVESILQAVESEDYNLKDFIESTCQEIRHSGLKAVADNLTLSVNLRINNID